MPDIGQPSETDKNSPNEIRDGVVSDSTRFPGGFIDQQITQAGAPVSVVGKFSLATATFVSSFDISPQDTDPTGIAYSSDGSRLYMVGKANNNINQYSLSSAFDASSASFTQSVRVNFDFNSVQDIALRADGSRVYFIATEVATNDISVVESELSTAFDISTKSLTQSFSVETEDQGMQGLTISDDGAEIYTCGGVNDNIYQYSLSTAFDISTESFVRSFSVDPQDGDPQAVSISPDGSKVYVIGDTNDNIYQYSLSTAFDISTASFIRSFDVSTEGSEFTGLALSPDGTRIANLNNGNDNVSQYTLGELAGESG